MLATPKLLDPSQDADFFSRMEATKICETRTKNRSRVKVTSTQVS
jgi:hypothetical protein